MKHYNYKEEVTKDIKNYIKENINFDSFDNYDGLKYHLQYSIQAVDTITGIYSGTHTNDKILAEIFLIGNFSLLAKALQYSEKYCKCGIKETLEEGAEACDALIRRYLLDDCIVQVMLELQEELECNTK
jgi:hypothetical protein